MAERYELSDEAWAVVSYLFVGPARRRPPQLEHVLF
jgi:hypothetical protein